jgi:hypothetical protein
MAEHFYDIVWENLALLKPTDQIKFVIASRRDFDWTVDSIREHALDRRFVVLLSSVFGRVTPRDLAEWLLDSRLDVPSVLPPLCSPPASSLTCPGETCGLSPSGVIRESAGSVNRQPPIRGWSFRC